MALTINDLKEMTGEGLDNPPVSVGFSSDITRMSVEYTTDAAWVTSDITSTVKQLIGTTDYAGYTTGPNAGMLKRTPPAAHPQYPWLYADAVPVVQGCGKYNYSVAAATVFPFNSVSVPQFVTYNQLRWKVDYTQLPYTPLPDANVQLFSGYTWVNPAGSTVSFSYVNEWVRFTSFTVKPLDRSVTASLGQLTLRGTGAGFTATNNSVKKYLPDTILKVKWYKVPYSYVLSSNSYLNKYKGYINQTVGSGKTFSTYTAGALLYIGYDCSEPYTMADPSQVILFGSNQLARFVDIEMNFLATNRTATGGYTPSNANYIASGGWNCQPWFKDGKYYYCAQPATPGTEATSDTPPYLSVPHEILFMNPDVPNANI